MRKLTLALLLAACTPQLQYIPDPDGTDYWQTPAETLQRGGGDCDDLSLLYWSKHQDQWLVHGTADGIGHLWVEDGKGNITFTTAPTRTHVADVYFNATCYHVPDSTKCGDATHIQKWNRVLKAMRAEQ